MVVPYAEAGIAAHHDADAWPSLTLPFRDQFDQRAQHAGRIAVARAQYAGQDVLAAKDV